MTVRERILASRLIERIDCLESFADQIGLNGTISKVDENKELNTSTDKKRKKGQ